MMLCLWSLFSGWFSYRCNFTGYERLTQIRESCVIRNEPFLNGLKRGQIPECVKLLFLLYLGQKYYIRTPSSTRPGFELLISRSWQYISCHWDACSNHSAISDLYQILSTCFQKPSVQSSVLLFNSTTVSPVHFCCSVYSWKKYFIRTLGNSLCQCYIWYIVTTESRGSV